jgi:HlyD family secretion protein
LLLTCMLAACQSEAGYETPYQGTLEHEQKILSFELPGRLQQVTVERGDVLERYQALARLDDTLQRIDKSQLEAQARASAAELDLLYAGTRKETIRQARARLTAALANLSLQKDELRRSRELYARDLVSEKELRTQQTQQTVANASVGEAREALAELRVGPRAQEIQAGEARLEAANIAIEAASERIRRHVLYAPGPGEVLDVAVKRGEFVAPGTPAVTLADTTRPYVDVFVAQGEIARFKVGAAVNVRVDTYDQPFGARVQFISPVMEFTPRYLFSPRERPNLVVRVRVRIHDPERKLAAGIPAFVDPDGASADAQAPPPLSSLVPPLPSAPLNPPEPPAPSASAAASEAGKTPPAPTKDRKP